MGKSNTQSEVQAHDTLLASVQETLLETFPTMTGGETIHVGSIPEAPLGDGVFGIISLNGESNGSFMIGFPKTTAQRVVNSLFGLEAELEPSDVRDGIGEIANILAGDVVARLEDRGFRSSMSLPTIATGKDISLGQPHEQSFVWKEFNSPAGPFWVRVAATQDATFEAPERSERCPVCGK
jgi:CheY-specific phosphatase CheX